MSEKKKNPRRENRIAVYLPLEIRAAISREIAKKPVEESASTFIANALAEWLDYKGIAWRSGEDDADSNWRKPAVKRIIINKKPSEQPPPEPQPRREHRQEK